MTEAPASSENREAKKSLATEVLYPREKAKSMAERRTNKPWVRQMLLTALSAETIDSKGRKTKKMRVIVDKLLQLAMEGEQWAIQEVLNRVDGKPTQMLGSDPNNPLPGGGLVTQVQVVFVDPEGNFSTTPPSTVQDITPEEKAPEHAV